MFSCPLKKLNINISPRSLPMIVTPYGHILYTKVRHFACRSVSAICIAQPGGGGGGIPTAHAYVLTRDPLPVRCSNSMRVRSKKVFSTV